MLGPTKSVHQDQKGVTISQLSYVFLLFIIIQVIIIISGYEYFNRNFTELKEELKKNAMSRENLMQQKSAHSARYKRDTVDFGQTDNSSKICEVISQNCRSETGMKGEKGDEGRTRRLGLQGWPGPRGLPGLPGSDGLPGVPGLAGQKKEKRDAGDESFDGVSSFPGLVGPSGSHGPHAPAPRPKGNQGYPGSGGVPGRPGLPGLPGRPGLPGLNGDEDWVEKR